MTDLAKLIEAVDAGSLDFGPIIRTSDLEELQDVVGENCTHAFMLAYSGSVDAALALKAELLGDNLVVEIHEIPAECWSVYICPNCGGSSGPPFYSEDSNFLGRALLLATLKAYQWEKEQ